MKLWHKNIFLALFLYVQMHAWSVAYFTPRDDLKSHLIQLIKEERVSIDAAIYMFTDKTIAQAVVDAYARGVKVRLILDQISMGEKYGKGIFLKNNDIDVTVFAAPALSAFVAPIMHHKFFIFGHNARLQKSLLWTGSYNCTASASRLHEENVIVTDDIDVIKEYKQCFKDLLYRLQPSRYIEIEAECIDGVVAVS